MDCNTISKYEFKDKNWYGETNVSIAVSVYVCIYMLLCMLKNALSTLHGDLLRLKCFLWWSISLRATHSGLSPHLKSSGQISPPLKSPWQLPLTCQNNHIVLVCTWLNNTHFRERELERERSLNLDSSRLSKNMCETERDNNELMWSDSVAGIVFFFLLFCFFPSPC